MIILQPIWIFTLIILILLMQDKLYKIILIFQLSVGEIYFIKLQIN